MSKEKTSAPCPLCNGRSWIVVSDLDEKPCRCLQRRMVRDHLASGAIPRIADAPLVRSPLFIPGVEGGDRTGDNMFIKASEHTLLSHLRWALGCKFNTKPSHTYRISSDARLLGIWLSKEAYTQKQKSTRDETEAYNNLADFVAPPDLFILLLGNLGQRNKAMPGVIQEALSIRILEGKPTWVFEDINEEVRFGTGHLSYSYDLAMFLDKHFSVIDFSAENKPEHAAALVPARGVRTLTVASEDGAAMGGVGPETVVRDRPLRSRVEEAAPSDIEDLGAKAPKRSGNYYSKRKPSGGGSPGGIDV